VALRSHLYWFYTTQNVIQGNTKLVWIQVQVGTVKSMEIHSEGFMPYMALMQSVLQPWEHLLQQKNYESHAQSCTRYTLQVHHTI